MGPAVIPTVDLTPTAHDNGREWETLAEDFGNALHQIGVVYLVGHGIDTSLLNSVLQNSGTLFSLPRETKKMYSNTNPLQEYNGFTDLGEERLGEPTRSKYEVKETYDIILANQKFPSETPAVAASVQELILALEDLKKNVFKLLAKALRIDTDFFLNASTYLENSGRSNWTGLRLLKYPGISSTQSIPIGATRCAEHSDWGLVTFLYQDSVGGLEARTRSGQWIDIPPKPEAILMNAGEVLEIWSRAYFPAVIHRVPFPAEENRSKDRYSFVFFTFPDDDVILEPLQKSQLLTQDYPYEPISIRRFIDSHIASSRA